MTEAPLRDLFFEELRAVPALEITAVLERPDATVFREVKGNLVDLLLDFARKVAVFKDVLGDYPDEDVDLQEFQEMIRTWHSTHRP